jgi:hypothetical protein
MEKFTCIRKIKFNKSILFNIGDEIIIINENENSYLISNYNRTKKINISKDDFNFYFKK